MGLDVGNIAGVLQKDPSQSLSLYPCKMGLDVGNNVSDTYTSVTSASGLNYRVAGTMIIIRASLFIVA
jgi:hypothetical protein